METNTNKDRLESQDILRGADMFLLLFLGPVLLSICKAFPDGTAWLSHQLQHVKWDGFVLWDLVMPLFLFLSGITIPFSMGKYKAGEKPDGKFYLKLLKRFCLLFLLGWIVQGNLLLFDWKLFHPFANTLQAIVVGYVVAALLFVHTDTKWQVAATVLLGCFAGQVLKSEKRAPAHRAGIVACIGVILVAAGLSLSPLFPIIKKIWSSTMTLYSGGICFLLTALTYYVVDVKKWRKGLSWLKIYGMNAITAYCMGEVVKFDSVSASLLPAFADSALYPVLIALFNALVLFAILLVMYRRKCFLKV